MRNPEAIPPVRSKHIRTLEKRQNYLIARRSTDRANSYERAELAALLAVLAAVKEFVTIKEEEDEEG